MSELDQRTRDAIIQATLYRKKPEEKEPELKEEKKDTESKGKPKTLKDLLEQSLEERAKQEEGLIDAEERKKVIASSRIDLVSKVLEKMR